LGFTKEKVNGTVDVRVRVDEDDGQAMAEGKKERKVCRRKREKVLRDTIFMWFCVIAGRLLF